MRIILILMTMLGAGYLSAQGVTSCNDNENSEQSQQIALDDNASYYHGGHRGWHGGHGHRHHRHGHHGWRGGWGRGWGYGGYYGYPYSYGYEGYGYDVPVEKLPPIVEEVRVPVVKRQEVLQEVIKVVRPEVRIVKVPRTVRKTIVGSPIEAPIVGAPAPVAGPPQGQQGPGGPPPQGDGGQQGGPPQGDNGQQGGPQGDGGQQGGGQMPSFGGQMPPQGQGQAGGNQ